MSYVRRYLHEVSGILQRLPQDQIDEIIDSLYQARAERRQVFIIGNGGSAATASHFANDLLKGATVPGKPRFKAIALTDSVPVMLAYANDNGYDCIFSEQLDALAEPGDLLVAFSGSGRSPNIICALDTARERGLSTIGFTARDGGEMFSRCDICLVAPCQVMEMIEDVHMVLTHLICTAIREERSE
ncbi:MAG TPA: SIS domain-containing protein [Chloroflexi bacterium]|jgi:D-sedoheptulose 7-phosphate isomerase|nr:SIS domain-containing protein [Chloroflexota bacterium]